MEYVQIQVKWNLCLPSNKVLPANWCYLLELYPTTFLNRCAKEHEHSAGIYLVDARWSELM